MLDKLPEDLERLLPEIRDEWKQIALSTEPANRELAEKGVDLAYQAAGLKPPETKIWFRSPREGAIGASSILGNSPFYPSEPALKNKARGHIKNITKAEIFSQTMEQSHDFRETANEMWGKLTNQLNSQGWNQGWKQFQDHLWQEARGMTGNSIRSKTWAQIENQIKDKIENKVWEKVRLYIWIPVFEISKIQQSIQEYIKKDFGYDDWTLSLFDNAIFGQHDAHSMASYFALKDYIPDVQKLEGHWLIARNSGWWWPFENTVILTERPSNIMLDKIGRFHCKDGPAIEYPDGFKLYFWHGFILPENQQYFIKDHSKLVSADSVDREEDPQIQLIKLEVYGYEKYLKERPHKIIHEGTQAGQRKKLIEVRVGHKTLKILNTIDNSTEAQSLSRSHFMRVGDNVKRVEDAI